MTADPLAGLLGPAVTAPARKPLQAHTTVAITPDTGERFIVGRLGERSEKPVIVIRQVVPASCKHTLSKREAWDLAVSMATPRKRTASALGCQPGRIDVTDLHGETKIVRTAEEAKS